LEDAADDAARAACEGLAASASVLGAVGPCEGLATVAFAFLARFFLSFLVFVFVRSLGDIPPSDGTYTGEIDSCVDAVAAGTWVDSLAMGLVISAMRSSLQNPAFATVADFFVGIVVGTVAGQHAHVVGGPCEGF
jgi:hypothetical protein